MLAASPAVIYTTKASGRYACTFVSENIRAIIGFSPEETTDPKHWLDNLHPQDAPHVIDKVAGLLQQGGGTVEYPLSTSPRALHLDPGYLQGFEGRDR